MIIKSKVWHDHGWGLVACVRLWNTSLLRQCSAINVRVCHTFFVAGSFLDKPIVEKETLGIFVTVCSTFLCLNFYIHFSIPLYVCVRCSATQTAFVIVGCLWFPVRFASLTSGIYSMSATFLFVSSYSCLSPHLLVLIALHRGWFCRWGWK